MRKIILTITFVIFAVMGVNAQFSNMGNTSKPESKIKTWNIPGHGEISLGFGIGKVALGAIESENIHFMPELSGVYGAIFRDYFFFGGGMGFKYYIGGDELFNALFFPIFLDTRVFVPLNEDLRPYGMFNIGYSLCVTASANSKSNNIRDNSKKTRSINLDGGLCFKIGVGVSFKKVTVGIGYERQNMSYSLSEWGTFSYKYSAFFFSLGYIFKK